MKDQTCIVQLGRLGDLVNVIPLLKHLSDSGSRPAIMVQRDYRSLFDGIGYADVFDWPGLSVDVVAAKALAEETYAKVLVTKVNGANWTTDHLCDSFCIDSWRLAGCQELFGKIPLIFDKRNAEREECLVKALMGGNRPCVLWNPYGISAPFRYEEKVSRELWRWAKARGVRLINIKTIQADRFYDLLGMYDAAKILVTIDTSTLHLARASKVPVFAFLADSPDEWHGSVPPPNCLWSCRYKQVENRLADMMTALDRCLEGNTAEAIAAPRPGAKLIHVWSDYDGRSSDAQKRHEEARQTWYAEYRRGNWKPMPLHERNFTRNTRTQLGEPKTAPFINDMLDYVMDETDYDDWVVLTNDDVSFAEGFTDMLMKQPRQGMIWGARREHSRLPAQQLSLNQSIAGFKHIGADLFCLTKPWWDRHGDEMPLMALSFEMWDLILRKLIIITGGKEVDGWIYHQTHQPQWHSPENRSTPAAVWNRDTGTKWLDERHISWEVGGTP